MLDVSQTQQFGCPVTIFALIGGQHEDDVTSGRDAVLFDNITAQIPCAPHAQFVSYLSSQNDDKVPVGGNRFSRDGTNHLTDRLSTAKNGAEQPR